MVVEWGDRKYSAKTTDIDVKTTVVGVAEFNADIHHLR